MIVKNLPKFQTQKIRNIPRKNCDNSSPRETGKGKLAKVKTQQ